LIELVIKNVNTIPKDVLAFVGQVLIQDQNFTKAYEILSKIVDSTDDLKIKAGYLSALAEKDVNAASDYFNKIDFALPELSNDRDLHELIEEPLNKGQQEKKKREKTMVEKVEETKKGGKIFIPKTKSKKKIKYPKNFDPANPGPLPDPERWIPKWQRSKGKRKLRMKGPQGYIQNIGMHAKTGPSTSNIEAASASS